jgi:anti-anti-sigma factor
MPLQATNPPPHVEAAGGTVVVRLPEEAFREANVGLTGKRLFQLADDLGPQGLHLDLAAVQFLTSTGLGKLVALHKRVAAAGGRLTLTRVCPQVYEVFEVTRLTQLLDVRQTGANNAEAA